MMCCCYLLLVPASPPAWSVTSDRLPSNHKRPVFLPVQVKILSNTRLLTISFLLMCFCFKPHFSCGYAECMWFWFLMINCSSWQLLLQHKQLFTGYLILKVDTPERLAVCFDQLSCIGWFVECSCSVQFVSAGMTNMLYRRRLTWKARFLSKIFVSLFDKVLIHNNKANVVTTDGKNFFWQHSSI